MRRIVETLDPSTISNLNQTSIIAPIDPLMFRQHAPSAHFMLLENENLLARASIWSDNTPKYLGEKPGAIGHYAAVDLDSGVEILNHATHALQSRGLSMAVGPMDGNTWRRYRLLTNRGTEPTFLMEPDNPDDWPSHFEKAGFAPLSRYFSAVNEDLSVTDPRVPTAIDRFHQSGGSFRNLDLNRLEDELRAIHQLSVDAFKDNFLYTPISRDEFVGMYLPYRSHMKSELILLAEQKGELVGFIFGIPNLREAENGKPVVSAIAKTMAAHPKLRGIGLGSVLMDRFQQAARVMGYTRVIHALMHENNLSMNISRRYGKIIRQYTLFARKTRL